MQSINEKPSEELTRQEIEQLTRWGAVALVARCAFRARTMFLPEKQRDHDQIRGDIATRRDYESLMSPSLGFPGEVGLAVPREFFEQPLWPDGFPTDKWGKEVLGNWHGLLAKYGFVR